MQSTIETRVVKVGDFVIIKEEYILYKGNPFEHLFNPLRWISDNKYNHDRLYHSGTFIFIHRIYSSDQLSWDS